MVRHCRGGPDSSPPAKQQNCEERFILHWVCSSFIYAWEFVLECNRGIYCKYGVEVRCCDVVMLCGGGTDFDKYTVCKSSILHPLSYHPSALPRPTMPPPSPSQSATLYQSPSKAVTLLDIPLSISLAQGTPSHPHRERIFSSEPLQHPYPSTEPKSQKAWDNAMRTMPGSAGRAFPTKVLYEALEEIRANYPCEEWCLPRQVQERSQERQVAKADAPLGGDIKPVVFEPEIQIPIFNRWSRSARRQSSYTMCKVTVNSFENVQAIAYGLIHNPHSIPLSLSTVSPPQSFNVPSGSAFYLANIDKRSAIHFSASVRSFYSTPTATAGPGQFDLILLDPPWDNRSAKRSGGYPIMPKKSHPMDVLVEMLGQHIAPAGVVVCWITNKRGAREWVMRAFESWGVELVEEWAWLKTTATSIPVADIEGVWRKPYEIVLVGRQVDRTMRYEPIGSTPEQPILQRVIVAVPDIHSRKPCLKELLESVILHPQNYRALEVFARSLTAGWYSWGNEAIKYNRNDYWAKEINCSLAPMPLRRQSLSSPT